MNNRWVRILLGALVLGTWGAVIQRAIRRPAQPEAPRVQQTQRPSSSPVASIPEELPVLHRDPFLDNDVPRAEQHTASRSASPTGSHAAAKAAPAPPKNWPEIRYNGIVRPAGEAGAGVAFLSVGGRSVLLKRGQDAQGVQVVDMSMDSVAVVWNTERRTIHRH